MESTWLNLPIQLQANKSMPTLTFLVQNSGPKVPPKLHCLAPSTFSPTGGKNELCGSAVNVFYPLCPKFQDSHFFLEVNVLPNASLCASGQAKPNNIPKPSGVWIRESFIAGPCKKNGWFLHTASCTHLLPNSHSVMLHWQFEFGRGGRIYTLANGKHYKLAHCCCCCCCFQRASC